MIRYKWDMPHKDPINDYNRTREKKVDLDNDLEIEDIMIYCDLDGVLCDFLNSALNRLKDSLENPEKYPKQEKYIKKIQKIHPDLKNIDPQLVYLTHYGKETPKNKPFIDLMYSLIRHDKDFWSNLEWIKGGKELWNYIKKYNVTILSAPLQSGEVDKECIEGKSEWITKNLGNIPSIFETKKEKYANKNSILIDDFIFNIENFRKAGGYSILHKDTSYTIRNLNRLITFLSK